MPSLSMSPPLSELLSGSTTLSLSSSSMHIIPGNEYLLPFLRTLRPLNFRCKDSGTSMMITLSNPSLSTSIITMLSRFSCTVQPFNVFFPEQDLCRE
uniref:Uncharacterized protein LOC101508180 isoform X1 n=1 Tax=Rhizophora mucronata TaxID=61149 RepID=A0A2P2MRU4_RHIMU